MERETSGFTKVFLRFGFASILGLSLVLVMESKKSDCVGKTLWRGDFGEITTCVTVDNRVDIQKSGYSPHLLPFGVCRLSQTWITGEFVNWDRPLMMGLKIERNSMNLETGEIGDPDIRDNTYFVQLSADPFGC